MAHSSTFPRSDLVPADRQSVAGWRIVILASLGGTLEFYDFVIFGVFAKDIAEPAAEGHFTHVYVGRATRRPAELPAEWREQLQSIMVDRGAPKFLEGEADG